MHAFYGAGICNEDTSNQLKMFRTFLGMLWSEDWIVSGQTLYKGQRACFRRNWMDIYYYIKWVVFDMGMDQNIGIPLSGDKDINQLFWCSPGTSGMTHTYMISRKVPDTVCQIECGTWTDWVHQSGSPRVRPTKEGLCRWVLTHQRSYPLVIKHIIQLNGGFSSKPRYQKILLLLRSWPAVKSEISFCDRKWMCWNWSKYGFPPRMASRRILNTEYVHGKMIINQWIWG